MNSHIMRFDIHKGLGMFSFLFVF